MAYSDFSLTKFRNNFHITINEEADLFATVEPIEISEKLTNTLEETTERPVCVSILAEIYIKQTLVKLDFITAHGGIEEMKVQRIGLVIDLMLAQAECQELQVKVV